MLIEKCWITPNWETEPRKSMSRVKGSTLLPSFQWRLLFQGSFQCSWINISIHGDHANTWMYRDDGACGLLNVFEDCIFGCLMMWSAIICGHRLFSILSMQKRCTLKGTANGGRMIYYEGSTFVRYESLLLMVDVDSLMEMSVLGLTTFFFKKKKARMIP